jgi:hypothetical protein
VVVVVVGGVGSVVVVAGGVVDVVVDGGGATVASGGGADTVDTVVVGWVTPGEVSGGTDDAAGGGGDVNRDLEDGRVSGANGDASDPRLGVGAPPMSVYAFAWIPPTVVVVVVLGGAFLEGEVGGANGLELPAATRLGWVPWGPCWNAAARPMSPPPTTNTASKINGNRRCSIISNAERRIGRNLLARVVNELCCYPTASMEQQLSALRV